MFGKQVCHTSFGPILVLLTYHVYLQDTHVPRAGRDLIRSTLEDAKVPVSVSPFYPPCIVAWLLSGEPLFSSWKSKRNMRSFEMNHPKAVGTRH